MKRIIYVVNDSRRSFTYDRVAGFNDAIRKSHEPINFYVFRSAGFSEYDPAHNCGEYNIYRLPDLNDFDGIVLDVNNVRNTNENLYGARGASYIVRAAAACNKPVISIANKMANFYYLGIDNDLAMTSMIEYLHKDLLIKDFWFIMGPSDNYENMIRTEALKNYCKANRIPFEKMQFFTESFALECGIHGFNKLYTINGGRLPQAIICANDPIAVGVCSEASLRGINIPGDVYVTGFDNLNISSYLSPSITTIDQFQWNIGQKCLDLFNKIWNGEKVEPVTYMETAVVVRESTGGPKPSFNSLQTRMAETAENDLYTEKVTDRICTMQYNIPSCNSIEDICKVLELSISEMKCKGLWLALDKELYDYGNQIEIDESTGQIRTNNTGLKTDGYPDEIEIIYTWDKKNGSNYPHKTIKNIFPYFDNERGGVNYMFIPLHFMEATVGFLVINDGDKLLQTKNMATLVNTLTMALRNFFAGKKLEYVNQMLSGISMKDNLTGLCNRLGYHHLAARLFKRTHSLKKSLGVLFIDMDKMKYFNDTFGHACGDDAIRSLSTSISKCIPKDAIPVRFGGDEFLVITPIEEEEEIKVIIQNIRDTLPTVAKEYSLPDVPGMSTGYVITNPNSKITLNEYVEEADKLMYHEKKAKRAGRA
ncbi:MAG: GGDEF domain-containing protein [Lachnospiraceae bacterium]|nr:GGDEF domain-containing protein [Lachnospiraceae bacterium]